MSSPTPTLERPKLAPTATAAKHTGLPKSRMRALIRQGMPCVRVGTKLYFDLAEVDSWIDKNLRTITAPTEQDAHRSAIKALVDGAPEITPEQAARIRAVLGGAA